MGLKERIRRATEESAHARNRYTERVIQDLVSDLKEAEDQVKKALSRYTDLTYLSENNTRSKAGLKRLQGEIDSTLNLLKKRRTLRYRKSLKESFAMGIAAGIGSLVRSRWPSFDGLDGKSTSQLQKDLFTLIDRDALDFYVNYTLVLAGDLHRDLKDGIKRSLMSGIALGKDSRSIIQDLGKVVKDPDSFRNAGARVFTKARHRLEVITRTEVLRAHNQGRLKCYREIGVQRLEWLTMEEERVCPVCRPLHEKVFSFERFPMQPKHPQCRCTSVVSSPIELLSPEQIRAKAKNQTVQNRNVQRAFESGSVEELSALTKKQLTDLAISNGISTKRNKTELIRLVKEAEPAIAAERLKGADLQKVLSAHEISRSRTKNELVKELVTRKKILDAKKQSAAEFKGNPKKVLSNLPLKKLQELAEKNGISTRLTRTEVVEMLNELNPEMEHDTLDPKSLLKAKERFGIGSHKNRKHYIRALEKIAGDLLLKHL